MDFEYLIVSSRMFFRDNFGFKTNKIWYENTLFEIFIRNIFINNKIFEKILFPIASGKGTGTPFAFTISKLLIKSFLNVLKVNNLAWVLSKMPLFP